MKRCWSLPRRMFLLLTSWSRLIDIVYKFLSKEDSPRGDRDASTWRLSTPPKCLHGVQSFQWEWIHSESDNNCSGRDTCWFCSITVDWDKSDGSRFGENYHRQRVASTLSILGMANSESIFRQQSTNAYPFGCTVYFFTKSHDYKKSIHAIWLKE